ncbi:unnamed protein product [Linum trigynum]|uniref:Uncharacterized protein n=1 Tax=Linum trigynum TaxID=586398 RepID=A0AAV2D3A8_9ROSI
MNGRTTSFWHHPWLDYGICLKDHVLHNANTQQEDSSVADWTDDNEDWDWEKLHHLFPPDILSMIAGMEPPKSNLGKDKCIWGLKMDGQFRLKCIWGLERDGRFRLKYA